MLWLATVCLLALGLLLLLLAWWRRWAPSLALALAVGAALRVAVLLVAHDQAWRPYDLTNDFTAAGGCVLDGRDPLFCVEAEPADGSADRQGSWHFLPAMAYVFAAQLGLGQLLHLPWSIIGRVVPVVADLALAVVIGRLAGRHAATARFQHACNPLAVLVCALHGQITPVALLFAVAALLAARGRRGKAAGALLGTSIATNSWPAIFLPAVLAWLPGWRRRLAALVAAAGVPAAFLVSAPLLLDSTLRQLPDAAALLLSTRPVVGQWGWAAVVAGGEIGLAPTLSRIGLLLLLVALLVAGVAWRRAHPVDLSSALLLVFLAVTPRMGAQYLLWPVPLLTARPTRLTPVFLVVASLWAGVGYLYLTQVDWETYVVAHQWWAYSSLAVIAASVAALPWGKRRLVRGRHAASNREKPAVPAAHHEPQSSR